MASCLAVTRLRETRVVAMPLDRPERYRRAAAECRRLAEIAEVPNEWLELAAQWESLARKMDVLLAPDRRPREGKAFRDADPRWA